MKQFIIIAMLVCSLLAKAQLIATVSSPKVTGQKTVVMLAITNNLSEKVESARAVIFLLNDQGIMVGQSTKWVIGGTRARPALEPKNGTTFTFVITSPQPFTTTNLTAKVSFSRVILEGEKTADLKTDVLIQNTQ